MTATNSEKYSGDTRLLRELRLFIVWPWSTRNRKARLHNRAPDSDVDPEALPQASFAFCSVN